MEAFIAGFTLLLSLIVAIGSQNAFILRQGILKQHVFIVCAFCALSDAVLIGIGVSGFGVYLSDYPVVINSGLILGICFLSFYGLKSLYSAWNNSHHLIADSLGNSSLKEVILLCIAFTWLNPLVLIDTVIIVGAASTVFIPDLGLFYCGALLGSFLFFFGLGFGAKLFSPFLSKGQSWKIIELLTGGIMLIMATKMANQLWT